MQAKRQWLAAVLAGLLAAWLVSGTAGKDRTETEALFEKCRAYTD